LGSLASIAAFDPRMNHAQILRCRKAWYGSLSENFGDSYGPRRKRILPKKVLKIGYVSSFFHRENWMKPVWGLINHHHRDDFQIHLFSDAPESKVKHGYGKDGPIRFHDISGYDNDETAELIAKNQIDILVDLNGFSEINRLPLYLKEPAPLLVAWFNVFATSGMGCFDYLIGDEWVVRKNEERWYVEEIVKLPISYLTFEVNYRVPEIKPPPCLRNKYVTFGSFAPLYKINAKVVEAWVEILKRSPSSKLLLKNAQLKYQCNRQHLLKRFIEFGISREQLILQGPETHYHFLKKYNLIDVALDTFPYNGGTTTTEAIWQGVPVLTFYGNRWVSRTSASILSNAGLGAFVCKDREEYIERAIYLSLSPETPSELKAIRLQMRGRLRKSSVCNCSGFAEYMENIYRKVWQSFCSSTSSANQV
jgi:protein O-GlcNAc transferase